MRFLMMMLVVVVVIVLLLVLRVSIRCYIILVGPRRMRMARMMCPSVYLVHNDILLDCIPIVVQSLTSVVQVQVVDPLGKRHVATVILAAAFPGNINHEFSF